MPYPVPADAAMASSPMKKSKIFGASLSRQMAARPAPPVKYEGLLATAGRPEPEPPLPPCWTFGGYRSGEDPGGVVVSSEACAVTVSQGEAKGGHDAAHRVSSIPCRCMPASVLNRNTGARRLLQAYLSMTTAGVWVAMLATACATRRMQSAARDSRMGRGSANQAEISWSV